MIDATWADEIRTLVDVDLETVGDADPFLMTGPVDAPHLVVAPRDATQHDDSHPLAELAVAAGAIRPEVAALAIPSRYRDLDSGAVLGRIVLVTTVHRRGPRDVHVRCDRLPLLDADDGPTLGPPAAAELSLSPVASLLHEALTRPAVVGAPAALGVLVLRGHRLYTRSSTGRDLTGLGPPSPAAVRAVDRFARELDRRHQPTACGHRPPRRPAVPADLPPGFVPACPL